jgi:hypothetical protein
MDVEGCGAMALFITERDASRALSEKGVVSVREPIVWWSRLKPAFPISG